MPDDAKERALALAAQWESESQEMRERSVREGLPAALAGGHRLANLLGKCAADLRAAIVQDVMITVCDRCLRACCWKGIFMCDDAQGAGTRELSAGTLAIMDREHPDYWDGTYERGIEEADAKARGEGVAAGA